MEKGAVFTDAHYLHAATVTAVGHSTFMSGAPPAVSGIIGNDWYDRETNGSVTSVSDPATKVCGIPNAPIAVNDVAPTLAAILGLAQPSGSIGRVLSEILQ